MQLFAIPHTPLAHRSYGSGGRGALILFLAALIYNIFQIKQAII